MKDIQNIWQFFENLNEYVYAADIRTRLYEPQDVPFQGTV